MTRLSISCFRSLLLTFSLFCCISFSVSLLDFFSVSLLDFFLCFFTGFLSLFLCWISFFPFSIFSIHKFTSWTVRIMEDSASNDSSPPSLQELKLLPSKILNARGYNDYRNIITELREQILLRRVPQTLEGIFLLNPRNFSRFFHIFSYFSTFFIIFPHFFIFSTFFLPISDQNQ